MADIAVLDPVVLTSLGSRIEGLWETHRLDRKAAEDRWLQNLRQFRGIYDPEILTKIPTDRSKAYPKLTRWKVIGTVARLMQMLFPQTEDNYDCIPSPLPNLSIAQLQQVLDELVAKKAAADGIDPADVQCSDKEIEDAIYAFAKEKSERMKVKLKDDMQEMNFVDLARKVVFSAVLYNVGVLKGPMHVKYEVRTWQKNPSTGKYEAVAREKLKPVFEFLPVWNYYPDLTAVSLDKQDGKFERHVMTRAEIEALADRPDFLKPQIDAWLLKHATGNHTPEHWETTLKSEKKGDKTNVDDNSGRKYVTKAFYGGVTGHELLSAGVNINEVDKGKTFQANVWLLDNVVIKAKLALGAGEIRQHHEFVFEDDDLSLLGNGQCDTLRDSQLSLNEMTRMFLDEASVGGENLEVNTDLLKPGQRTDIQSHKVWLREGEGAEAQTPAVRAVTRQSRLSELQAGAQMFMEFANQESGLPPPSVGDVSQGGSEALRTQGNLSMIMGAAALPIRDTVRNYDRFTISVIGALVKWNMKYDPNDSRDGDFEILGRGSTSLIAKEVLAQSLDAFAVTLSPEEKLHLKTRKVLEARAKARDIPIAELFEDEKTALAAISAMQKEQSEMADAQKQEIAAHVRQLLADSLKKVAEARKADASVQTDAVTLLMEILNGGSSSEASAA